MEFTAVLVNRLSKGGKPYTAFEIVFPNGYKKLVFLTDAELHMINMMLDSNERSK